MNKPSALLLAGFAMLVSAAAFRGEAKQVAEPPLPSPAAAQTDKYVCRVAAPSCFHEGAEGLDCSSGNSGDWINADQAALKVGVERKAAPRPVAGMFD